MSKKIIRCVMNCQRNFQDYNSIYDNMKDDAYLCMASPHYVDLNPMIEEVGFELVEQYGIKMHRSLTRIISVIRKKNV